MIMPSNHHHNRRAGFTMIEVVAAIVILSLAIVPLAQVFYIGTKIVSLVKEDSELLVTSESAAEIYLSQDLFTPFMTFPNQSEIYNTSKFQITRTSGFDSTISPAGTLWIYGLTIKQPTAASGKSVNALHTNVLQAKSLAKAQRKYLTGIKEKILKK